MDFDLRIKVIENDLNEITDKYNKLLIAYTDARNFTHSFLECCERHGISTVAIQAKTKKIKSSINYPFGAYGSVFADKENGGVPTIWGVVHEMGIDSGCGNSGQHQITAEAMARLVDGVYTLKDGFWHREDERK